MFDINALRKIQDVCSLDVIQHWIFTSVFFLYRKVILATVRGVKKAEKEVSGFITEYQ